MQHSHSLISEAYIVEEMEDSEKIERKRKIRKNEIEEEGEAWKMEIWINSGKIMNTIFCISCFAKGSYQILYVKKEAYL